jgi:hypothetical protein
MSRSASHAGSYFPHSPAPQHQVGNPHHTDAVVPGDDSVTRNNTIANTNPHATLPVAPLGQRPAKFTEEWDASQRGSSVIDGPTSNTSNTMQRTNSYAGSIGPSEGNQTVSLSRGNTLKKKASIRRSGSLKRSGSRRSMKAGSVKSLALQSSNDPDELHSAFYCPVPTTGNPTEALANRFQGMPMMSLSASDHVLTQSSPPLSMAQDSQGPNHLLPRNPSTLRASLQVTVEAWQCLKQHRHATRLPSEWWS